MPEDIHKKIERLRQEIRHHDYLYYVLSQPDISDGEYDDLMRQLKNLEEKYPQYKSDYSPTVRLSGGILEGFQTVRHRQKMLSLENAYSFEELRDWEERLHKGLGDSGEIGYVAELKIDGVSANITYEKGRLKIAATRGDGESGEDVTGNIKTIRAIPLVLLGENIPELIEVRGEVYMDRRDFRALNKEREKQGLELFANPRNAASGSLKLLDATLVSRRRLNFFAHSLGEYRGEDIPTHWQYLEKLQNWAIPYNKEAKPCRDLDEVIAYCNFWQNKHQDLRYVIDGMVIKVNSITQQKKLGSTLKSPRWAIAYKFPAHQATTEIVKIKIQVGRTGIITPVAELSPVACGGVVIKHATLHNFDEIKRLNIKERDRVLIERAGEVIPKVVKVVRHIGKKAVQIPQTCPVCGGKVIKEKAEDVAYRCFNPSCPAQLKEGLLHFACRSAMDIEGMGEAAAEQLVRLKLVRNFVDIYKLSLEDLLKLELFKETKARNLIAAIEKSKRQSLSRLIYALGIRHVGEKAAYVLAEKFKTMDRLLKARKEDFDAIEDLGPVMSETLAAYFAQPATRKLIAGLRSSGLNLEQEKESIVRSPLSGKNIVFTGELTTYSRQKAKALVRKSGGMALSSVSKNIDFVVVGKNPGSKYNKAKALGIKIINEKEFQELIQ